MKAGDRVRVFYLAERPAEGIIEAPAVAFTAKMAALLLVSGFLGSLPASCPNSSRPDGHCVPRRVVAELVSLSASR